MRCVSIAESNFHTLALTSDTHQRMESSAQTGQVVVIVWRKLANRVFQDSLRFFMPNVWLITGLRADLAGQMIEEVLKAKPWRAPIRAQLATGRGNCARIWSYDQDRLARTSPMSFRVRVISRGLVVPIGAADKLQQKFTCAECGYRYSSLGAAFFCPACGHMRRRWKLSANPSPPCRRFGKLCRRLPVPTPQKIPFGRFSKTAWCAWLGPFNEAQKVFLTVCLGPQTFHEERMCFRV